jgi:hypothetical protein
MQYHRYRPSDSGDGKLIVNEGGYPVVPQDYSESVYLCKTCARNGSWHTWTETAEEQCNTCGEANLVRINTRNEAWDCYSTFLKLGQRPNSAEVVCIILDFLKSKETKL